MWGDESEASEEPRAVACDSAVKLQITLYHRFLFSVNLWNPGFHATCAEADGQYAMSVIRSVNIPPKTKGFQALEYEFVPKTPGNFLIDKFQMNFWGYFDTSVSCHLPLVAMEIFPKVSIEICNMAMTALEDSCSEFSLNVTNIGAADVKGFRVVFDNPGVVIYRESGNVHNVGKCQVLTVTEDLEVSKTMSIPFIFHAPAAARVALHFFVDVNGTRVAFTKKEVELIPGIEVSGDMLAMTGDSSSHIIQCVIKAVVADATFCGILTSRGEYLSVLQSSEKRPIGVNEQRLFMALTRTRSESGVEPWRYRSMEESQFDLIYHLPGFAKNSQRRLDLRLVGPELGFSISVPSHLECKSGATFRCVLSMVHPKSVYVTPIPFGNLDSTGKRFNGCRWIGKTRMLLSETNGFRAEFSFMVLASGIYQIHGFRISESPDFSDSKALSCGQRMRVSLVA
jgi:hypothetical protein